MMASAASATIAIAIQTQLRPIAKGCAAAAPGRMVDGPHNKADGPPKDEATAEADAIVAQAREEVEDAVEVRLSKDEQLQQRRANQRLGAEVMSQRIREMSDNDPRVVALVIRQWINNDHE